MRYKLVIEGDKSLPELRQHIKNGGRFIVFSYCISLFAITLKRMSPAIFIENDLQFRKYKKRYNMISLTLGWWGIPWGLIHTPNFVRANNRGGIDVTNDVLLNITEASFKERQLEFLETTMLFDFPEKEDERIFRKHFTKVLADTPEIKKLAVGLYLNTEDGVMPYYVIGIESADYYENYIEEIRQRLYTDFYRHVRFRFMDMEKETDLAACIVQQGLVLSR